MQRNKLIPMRAWLICGIVSLFVAFHIMMQMSPSIMIAELMQSLHISVIEVTLLSSSYNYAYLILQLPSGILIDKYGPRRVISVGVWLCGLACALFALASNFIVAGIARLLMGFAFAPAVAVSFYLCVRWFPPYMFAFVVGLIEMIGTLGGLGQYVLSSILDFGYDWRTAIGFCVLFSFVLAIVTYIYVYDNQTDKRTYTHWSLSSLWEILKPVLGNKQVWLNGLYTALMFVIISGFAAFWNISYLQQVYAISVMEAAKINGALFVGAAISAPLVGWLSDYIGRRKPLMYVGALASLLTEIIIIGYPPQSIFWMTINLFMLGLFSGSYMLPFAIVRDQVPLRSQGSAMGFTNMMNIILGAPIFQPIVGLLLHHVHTGPTMENAMYFTKADFQTALLLLPIGTGIALLIVYFVKETYCKSLQEIC